MGSDSDTFWRGEKEEEDVMGKEGGEGEYNSDEIMCCGDNNYH